MNVLLEYSVLFIAMISGLGLIALRYRSAFLFVIGPVSIGTSFVCFLYHVHRYVWESSMLKAYQDAFANYIAANGHTASKSDIDMFHFIQSEMGLHVDSLEISVSLIAFLLLLALWLVFAVVDWFESRRSEFLQN